MKNKYYFITYIAKVKAEFRAYSTWNQCIKDSPMKFIKRVEKREIDNNGYYVDFVVINTCEISQKEYNEYKNEF
jgi:flagellum-specific peptidoglycan hydrolase FlgJ